MEKDKDLTVGELVEKLKSLEKEISPWAKGGMRAYTPDELTAYNASLVLIGYLESQGIFKNKEIRAYWTLHAPNEHKTIKESKPIDAKGDELEVFEKVHAKIVRGEGDIDDFNFVKEIEKRIEGIDIFDAELRDKTIPMMAELKRIIANTKNK